MLLNNAFRDDPPDKHLGYIKPIKPTKGSWDKREIQSQAVPIKVVSKLSSINNISAYVLYSPILLDTLW